MVQAKAYMKYPQENIVYTLGFLGLCNIFIPMLTKKMNHDLKYHLSKQFQVFLQYSHFVSFVIFLFSSCKFIWKDN
jgi:hypothetical protein